MCFAPMRASTSASQSSISSWSTSPAEDWAVTAAPRHRLGDGNTHRAVGRPADSDTASGDDPVPTTSSFFGVAFFFDASGSGVMLVHSCRRTTRPCSTGSATHCALRAGRPSTGMLSSPSASRMPNVFETSESVKDSVGMSSALERNTTATAPAFCARCAAMTGCTLLAR